jgi:hypothetical protein
MSVCVCACATPCRGVWVRPCDVLPPNLPTVPKQGSGALGNDVRFKLTFKPRTEVKNSTPACDPMFLYPNTNLKTGEKTLVVCAVRAKFMFANIILVLPNMRHETGAERHGPV